SAPTSASTSPALPDRGVPARNGRRSARVAVAFAVAVVAGPLAFGRLGLAQEPGSFPPPTPVPPNGSPSPYPTALSTPPPSYAPPDLAAASAILMELEGGRTLFARAANVRRPIASLTKVMTALLVVERTDPGEQVVATATAVAATGSELGLRVGEVLPVDELLHALLLQSANDAAVALAEHVGGTVDGFVAEMNVRAQALGLADTRFFSPNGLDDRGYSTAADLARLTRAAVGEPEIDSVVSTKFHAVPNGAGGGKRSIQNRNALLWLYEGAEGVKTGFTTAAGYCLIATATRGDEHVVGIVLGEPSQAWNDTATLLNFGFFAFDRRDVVAENQELPAVEVDGVQIPTVAGGAVPAYVHERRPEVRIEAEPGPGLSFPVLEGQTIGEAVVLVRGAEVGRVQLLVGDLPPLPGEGRPLWMRVLQVVVASFGDLTRRTFVEAATA
ncbi:MAG: D-alanyl-D-alanine carboxypeptidase, partial [Actinobacteria bacterium]|nr:D-alanyl-D-alanine carboxypeptidase [Actinomycetota bacterium]